MQFFAMELFAHIIGNKGYRRSKQTFGPREKNRARWQCYDSVKKRGNNRSQVLLIGSAWKTIQSASHLKFLTLAQQREEKGQDSYLIPQNPHDLV